MSKFLESEKPHQSAFKQSSPTFTPEARQPGLYKTKYRPFCLPLTYAELNLFPGIRESALQHFARHEIKWHDGQNGKCSNHMCDSQVCCVNFLFPFADQPHALAQLLKPIFPLLDHMLPVEDGKLVSFEWIGSHNYLGEKISRNGKRTRGANYTSADAIVLFERTDKKRQIALIEWKYTESYGGTNLKFAKSGTDRTGIYRHLYDSEDCPIRKELLPGFDALFFEPFYQFMRQQFLAHEMEKAREMDADIVSLLHIAPAHNLDFKKVTSPALKHLGSSPTEIWGKLVKDETRFKSVYTEDLFGKLAKEQLPELTEWLAYVLARYDWIKE
ncbi:MAG: hypothetical protein CVU41_14645 [Chloroflexi bacterium HGW-Chloroflexi-3]|nr:MAG: hypothetical protein CVU41_14645 [Chloroflexi bacterium HGW-Chloroflexi-3]